MSTPRAGSRRDKARAELSKGGPGRLGVEYEGRTPYGPRLAIEAFRLENGLRVLILEDHSAPVAAFHTWFRVGSRHERPGKTGLAHLLEHLMFNEFDGLPAGEFDRRMEQAGAETNAATWVDWTYYYEHVPSSQLGMVIQLEAKRMGQLLLRDDLVRSELEVVANERRYRVDDDVDGAVNERLYALAYERHGYHNPTIGWMDDIQGLTRGDCEEFYRTYYAPNNATVVIAGSVDELRVIRQMASAYAYLRPAELPVEDKRPELPQLAQRSETVHKPTATDKLALGYHGPALGDVDHAPLTLLCDVLFGGRASRVYQAMVQHSETALDARGWLGTFEDPGLLEVQLTAREGHQAEEMLASLDAELSKVVREPITEQELERAKSRAELGLVRGMETCGGKAEQIAFFDVVVGDPAGAMERLNRYRRVTRGDMLRTARRYLRPEMRTVLTVKPADAAAGATEEAR